MRPRHLGILVLAMALPAAPLPAQEAATGTVQMEQRAPQPRGMVVEHNGQQLTGTLAPGASVDVQGANVVVEETPRATRLTVNNDVLFDFDKAELRAEGAQALGRVAEIIHQRNPRAVRIVGHTDSMGSDSYNQALSERRAQSVRQWLTANGGQLPPMQADGRGENEPVAANTGANGADNPEGRKRNCRVEVLLEK